MTTPYAAILAGGSGTRFWPASTPDAPKQLLPLLGGAPLLREAVDRIASVVPPERLLVVTSARYVDRVRDLLPELPRDHVVAEPCARNTAAACALAAHWVARRDAVGTLLTLPSDHVVSPAEDLCGALSVAAKRAEDAGTLVTLGLEPRHAATGYGWIESGRESARIAGRAIHEVTRFLEKPDAATAEDLLASGGHLWNLGMFAWRVDAFLDELARHLPGVGLCFEGLASFSAQALEEAFEDCPSISVDHGVLERSDRVECVPCSFEWDDLGAFDALARHVATDEHGNAAIGEVVALDARNCVAWAEGDRLTALLGVDDLIVVHTGRVTLVAPRDRAQDIKRLVAELRRSGREDLL